MFPNDIVANSIKLLHNINKKSISPKKWIFDSMSGYFPMQNEYENETHNRLLDTISVFYHEKQCYHAVLLIKALC
jgi:hypothetical protein